MQKKKRNMEMAGSITKRRTKPSLRLNNKGLLLMDNSITKTIINKNYYGPAIGKAKMFKCKFWPSCSAGENCRFHHPKEHCRNLPNCKFGQHCLNYHPPCKFGDECQDLFTCPFDHTGIAELLSTAITKEWSKAKAPSAASNGQISCKFHPNCSKPHCPYLHSDSAATGVISKFHIDRTRGNSESNHTHHAKNPYKLVNSNEKSHQLTSFKL